jgi:hypothetical protein
MNFAEATEEEIQAVMDDPRFLPFAAGYHAAKAKFEKPSRLSCITNELDSFVAWKEIQP